MSTDYAADGTYWSGRDRANEHLDVVLLRSGSHELVKTYGSYQKRGSAVAAAAELGYIQGNNDAIAAVREKVQQAVQQALQQALEEVGLGADAVTQPDISPEDLD